MHASADDDRHRRERQRRRLANLVLAFYLMILAEGPLRKWVMPGASNALVFMRDPLMLLLLALYLRLGPSPQMRRAMAAFGAVVLVFLICILCQAATSDVPPLAILAGFRNYFLFAPLCCVIPDAFSHDDYARWVKVNLVLAVPVAALVVVQYRSGPSALVNAAPGGTNEDLFLFAEGIVRPYGLFSFTLGHSAYAAWMASVALAAFSARSRLAIKWPLLSVGTLGIVVMGAFSGSRTYVLFAASIVGVFVAGAVVYGRADARKKAALAALVLGLAIAAVMVAEPSLVEKMLDRQATAVASEGATSDRIAVVLTEFMGEMSRVPPFGYGLGSGTNVANFLSNGRTDHVLAEYELTRIVQELGPFFGSIAILLRWGLVGTFTLAAMRAVRRDGNLQPLCFLGFVGPVFLVHDISLQNSMIAIGWFSAGILVAALRTGSARPVPRIERVPVRLLRVAGGAA